jgi:Na+/proline symporter
MIYLVLSAQFFGPLLYGIMIGGVFAAILSTADSQLLVISSTLVRDIYEKVWRRGKSIEERTRLWLSRLVLLLAGALALLAAAAAEDLVFWLVLFAWGGLGAAFGPALIFSLYWKKTSRAGALAGMIVGPLVVVVWRLFLKEATGLYELIPAFAAACLAIYIVSLLRRGGEEG